MNKTKELEAPVLTNVPFIPDFRHGVKLPRIDQINSPRIEQSFSEVNTPTPRLWDKHSSSHQKSRSMINRSISTGDGINKASALKSETSLPQDLSLASIRSVTITPKAKSAGGGDQLENEINQRISTVYRSIENLEKQRQNFDNSVRAATRRTVADIAKSKLAAKTSSKQETPPQPEEPAKLIRKSSRRIDVTRTYPKMFGLDPMKVIASSDEESDPDDLKKRAQNRRKPKKSIRKYLEMLVQDDPARDMSAIMPSLSEKTFLTKLQKRDSQLNKEINDMRVNLDVMHLKADREAKKGMVEMKHKNMAGFVKRPNMTKLIAADTEKGPGRELTDFLQATGGTTGGWEMNDHQVFIRGYQKWSSNPALMVENLSRLLPNKRPEHVVEHATWYEKYEKLNNANRSHIQKWTQSKRKERDMIFRMANQSRKSALEKDKLHQDLVKSKRAEELQKEHDHLKTWKKSKAMRSTTLEETQDTGTRITNMDKEMSEMRKEIREITAMTRDIGKSLRSLTKSDEEKAKKSHRSRVGTGSDASSGFCEMTLEEIESIGQDLDGDGEKFLHRNESAELSRSKRGPADAKKLMQDFRSRDLEMMNAKKKAIEERKEKTRNKAFLTDKQIKERMKKIKAVSKLTEPTKGWMIRNEIRELEKVESQNRISSALEKEPNNDTFAPVAHVTNIQKLGTPFWRQIS